MNDKRAQNGFEKKEVRRWTLYVVRLKNNHYYVGITSRRNFMKRINEHGGELGARVNRGNEAVEIVEIQDLGRVTNLEAQQIENDIMLQYRKKYGAWNVRGGYEISSGTSIIPSYTPGSKESYIFIAGCLALAILFLLFIIFINKPQ